MHYPKWLSLLAMGAAAGGMLLFGGVTVSAETALPEVLQTAETASAVVATATGPEFQPQTETPEVTGGWVIEDGCRKYQYSDGSFAVHATAVDGVLYSSDMTRLLCYPPARDAGTLILPGTLERIEDGAFRGASALREIRFAGTAADFSRLYIGSGNNILSAVGVTFCAETKN